MSFGKIIILGVVLWFLALIVKYLFFAVWGIAASWQVWAYYILFVILARVLSRRLGIINFLEAIFAGLVWLVIILVLDSVVGKRFLEPEVFRHKAYWLSYLAILIAATFLHKKRHIQIRKEIHAEHHH